MSRQQSLDGQAAPVDLGEPSDDGLRDSGGRGSSKVARRLKIITALIHEHGFVGVEELVERLGVSRMTVHRDLDELQRRGVLHKVHGGASVARTTRFESDFEYRVRSATDEKRRIAAATAELVTSGDVVMLDGSSTTLELTGHLVDKSPLTVITNSQNVSDRLRDVDGVSLLMLGGEYSRAYQIYLGILCEKNLSELRADTLFMTSSALHGDVVYHQDQHIVAVKLAMMRAARRRVLMIDHTKLGQDALHAMCSVGDFTHVVVDDGIDAESLRQLRESAREVIVASA